MPSCRTLRDEKGSLGRSRKTDQNSMPHLKETGTEIQKIREDLAREKDARINELRTETEDQLSRLTPITKPITKVFAVSCFRK